MKKFYLQILFLLIGCSCLLAQLNEKPFADTTLWHMHSVFIMVTGSGGNYEEVYIDNYFIIPHDTIINDTLYQQLYACNEDFTMASAEFKGYLSEQDNVVYYGTSINEMSVIYDFNLLVGDTFSFKSFENPNNPMICTLEVLSVDSILFNSSFRKRIQFESFPTSDFKSVVTPVWLEGVGDINYGFISDYGLINFIASVDGSSSIVCFSENNIPVIGNCQVTSDIYEKDLLSLKVYPNPCSDFIKIDGLDGQSATLQFYNLTGELIYETQAISDKRVNLSFLETGHYLLITKTSQETFYQILIKSQH